MSAHDELLRLCAAMYADGERMTYETLRTRHGGGSRRDIARALKTWRQQNPDAPPTAPGRPSRMEMRLRDIIQRQRATIHDLADEIRQRDEEIESLARMVYEYRAYPGDELPLEDLGNRKHRKRTL